MPLTMEAINIQPGYIPGASLFFGGGRRNWRSSWVTCAGWRAVTSHKGNDHITQCDKCEPGIWQGTHEAVTW